MAECPATPSSDEEGELKSSKELSNAVIFWGCMSAFNLALLMLMLGIVVLDGTRGTLSDNSMIAYGVITLSFIGCCGLTLRRLTQLIRLNQVR